MQTGFDVKENEKGFVELKAYINSMESTNGILMQTLHKAQEIFGYLPIEVQKFVSDETGISLAEIYGVATFYTQFSITPKGKYKIGVCMGTACYVRSAQAVLDKLAETLDIKVGTTTEDMKFTLEATRCLGCCGLAPVMMINDEVYGKVAPESIPGIIESYKE